jgi:hypothetical protein
VSHARMNLSSFNENKGKELRHGTTERYHAVAKGQTLEPG